jgi:hypothetical protein
MELYAMLEIRRRYGEGSHKFYYDHSELFCIVITPVISWFVVIDIRFEQTKELKVYIYVFRSM